MSTARPRRIKGWLLIYSALAFTLVSSPAPAAQETVTNETVVGMFKAGFSEGIVIEKIRTSSTKFDTSLPALTALKEAGVTDSVIRLMINPKAELISPVAVSSGAGMLAGQGPASPIGCELPPGAAMAPWMAGTSPAMWYSNGDDGRRIEINYERGTINTVGFAFIQVRLLQLKPVVGPLRLTGDEVFWSCINPNDMPLVKFTVDKDDDPEDQVRETSLGRGSSFSQEMSISEEDLVPMAFEKTPQGYFKIRPKKALSKGAEYGFVPQGGGGMFGLGERVYAFGVD